MMSLDPHKSRSLPPNQQLVRGQRWPIVGERLPRADNSPWTVTITGCVATPRTYALAELQQLRQVERALDIHCVTRWSKLQLRFGGVPLVRLLDGSATDNAAFVSFVARSDRAHSTSLPLAEAIQLDALVALTVEGQPLPTDHGGPVRMVVPGKYFYKSVKWLQRIELLAEDRLGYWESEAGYHNQADPWREQRYMAPALTKAAAARLIAGRDFRALDLRSIMAADRDLSDLRADEALIRDADFRRANLRRANFRGANLANAHLDQADLRDATLENADLEGANLAGADLRGANLAGASLFGASFCQFDGSGAPMDRAVFDEKTRISSLALDGLTEDQRSFVQSACQCE